MAIALFHIHLTATDMPLSMISVELTFIDHSHESNCKTKTFCSLIQGDRRLYIIL